jgi:hypothetical protein
MRVVLRPSPHQLVFNDSIPGVEGMASFAETLFRAPAVRAQAEAEREGNLLRMAQRSAAKPVGPQVGEVAPSHLTDRLTSVPQDVPRLDFLGRPVLDAAGNPVVDRKMVPLPGDAASENLRRGGIDPETFRFIERAMAAEQASSGVPTGVVPQQPGQESALPAEPTLIGQASAAEPVAEMTDPTPIRGPQVPASLIQQARIHDQDPAPRWGRVAIGSDPLAMSQAQPVEPQQASIAPQADPNTVAAQGLFEMFQSDGAPAGVAEMAADFLTSIGAQDIGQSGDRTLVLEAFSPDQEQRQRAIVQLAQMDAAFARALLAYQRSQRGG